MYNNLFATAFLHSILKRLLHFHNLFVKLLATYYIDVSIHKRLLYCLPEMLSIKVGLNIMDLIEAQIRRYCNAEILMKISRNAWKWYNTIVTLMCRNDKIECDDELSWLFSNRFSATGYKTVKRMGITETLRRIWLFSANKTWRTQKALNLLINNQLNSSLHSTHHCGT